MEESNHHRPAWNAGALPLREHPLQHEGRGNVLTPGLHISNPQ